VTDGLSVVDAPDPDLARVAVDRAREAGATVDDAAVVRLLGFSTAAADFLVRHPDEAAALGDPAARDRAALDAELADDVERRGIAAGLRRFRRRSMLRVAARDLAGAAVDDVVREISDIADACVAAACPPGLAVIALGKWGGRELNYSSDVDLLLVHVGEANDAGGLVRLLSEPTEDGIALKVDAAGGAGGRRGAIFM
jgi:glutamate-ammonia-ligase adenylyltransferase